MTSFHCRQVFTTSLSYRTFVPASLTANMTSQKGCKQLLADNPKGLLEVEMLDDRTATV